MPEHAPGDTPGHLDIDAVSAFIDRDLHEEDLSVISLHLAQCPECTREVLEVRTTVFLLSSLPQYEPRRSFCLGQEHARASRRRPATVAPAWDSAPLSSAPAGGPAGGAVAPPRFTSWLPGLQVAAMVTGVLLLLVTVGDWRSFSGNLGQQQLVAPTAAAGLPAEEAPMAAPAPNAAFQADSDSEMPAVTSDGTNLADSASQEMSEQSASRSLAISTASSGAAAVTQPLAGGEPASAPAAVSTVTAGEQDRAESEREPGSRLRLVQIALFAILAWLIVTIVGLRWVRRLR
jgi:hypothetical protein